MVEKQVLRGLEEMRQSFLDTSHRLLSGMSLIR